MKKRYKIQYGEWVSVYETVVAYIDSDVEPTKENLQELIEKNGVDYCMEDFDWTTQESEELDLQPFEILEELELEKQPKEVANDN